MDERDATAFREWVSARQGALFRSALLLTGHRQDAEDLLQSALTKLALRWSTIRHGESPDAYTRTTMYHEWISRWRRHRRGREYVLANASEAAGPGDLAEDGTLRVALAQVLAQLTPKQRAVIVLRFYEDRTESDVAEILGVSVGTVRSQTYRTLSRLRELCPELAPTKEFTP